MCFIRNDNTKLIEHLPNRRDNMPRHIIVTVGSVNEKVQCLSILKWFQITQEVIDLAYYIMGNTTYCVGPIAQNVSDNI